MTDLLLNMSFSRCDTFSNRCERLYALDALFPVESGSIAQEKGKQVHAMLEQYARDMLSTWPAGPLTEEELEPYHVGIAPLIDDLVVVNGTEVEITSIRDIPWKGFIDLIAEDQHGAVIWDYKTTKSLIWAPTPAEAKRSLQLQSYCLATDISRAAFVYIDPNGQVLKVEVDFTDEELDVAYRRIKDLVRVIELRWRASGADLDVDEQGRLYMKDPDPDKLNLSHFALAGSDMKWCGPKCRQAARCGLYGP